MTDAAAGTGRVAYFDNLKYVLILLVVIGHYIDPFSKIFPAYQSVFFFIYLFHMPLFVLVTGLFARGLLQADGRFRISRVPQFLLLYLILYAGIYGLELLAGKSVVFTPWSVANSSWYLLAAAIWYALIPALGRFPTLPLIGTLSGLALVAGYFPAIGDTLAISRVICFAPFFFLGFKLTREQLLAFADRRAWWRLAAAGLLALALAAPFVVPKLLRLRGLLSARNSYAFLEQYAPFGAGLRLSWYVSAVVLGSCVLFLVPAGRHWYSKVGERTLPIYLWHLWGLRGLALISLVPLTAAWAKVTPLAAVLPLALAVVATHLFALHPPFGLVADRILTLGKSWTVGPSARWVSLATAVALPVAAFASSSQPLVVGLPFLAPRPVPSKAAPAPGDAAGSALPVVKFESSLVGSVGFTVAPVTLAAAGGYPGGELRAGDWFTIKVDEGRTWIVQAGAKGGRLVSAQQLINLPDVVPSVVLAGEGAGQFTSSGVDLGFGGQPPSALVAANQKLGKRMVFAPVSLATAQKVQLAQGAALAAGDTLIVQATWRSEAAQQKLAQSLSQAYQDNPHVRQGVDGDGWDLAWFLPSVGSGSLGLGLDLSLGRVDGKAGKLGPDGWRPTQAEAYPMPSGAAELSRQAVTFAAPVSTRHPEVWKKAPPAPGLTPGAKRLQRYCAEAGLAPAAAAWWHFDDLDSARWLPVSIPAGLTIRLPE